MRPTGTCRVPVASGELDARRTRPFGGQEVHRHAEQQGSELMAIRLASCPEHLMDAVDAGDLTLGSEGNGAIVQVSIGMRLPARWGQARRAQQWAGRRVSVQWHAG